MSAALTAARREEGAALCGQTGRGAAGHGERAEDLHGGGGLHGEPGLLLALVSGKNVSLVGASTKDCALLYQNTAPVSPNLVKRLTFRNPNSRDVKTKFFGIGGGHVQIKVNKYFVRKYLAMI